MFQIGLFALHEKIGQCARVRRVRKFDAEFRGDELDAIPAFGSADDAADGERAAFAEVLGHRDVGGDHETFDDIIRHGVVVYSDDLCISPFCTTGVAST